MNHISKQILQTHHFFIKSLVGALLIYSIIGIPLFVGYVARYLHQLKDNQNLELPQWNHWLALLIESWELLVALALYFILPCGLLTIISITIDQYFGLLWPVVWFPTMLAALISPPFVVIIYQQYLMRPNLDSIFNVKQAYQTLQSNLEVIIAHTLTLWGAIIIGFPVFGFTIAISAIIYIPVMLHAIESNR